MERSDILSTLARVRPAAIVVRDAAGDERAIALRAGRTKWEHASTVLVGLLSEAGAVCELRDGRGAVLDVMRAEPPKAGTLGASELAPEHRALIAAQDHALDRQERIVRLVLDATVRALDSMQQRMSSLERQHERMLALTYRTTVDASQAVSEATLALAERESETREQASPLEGIATEWMQELRRKGGAAAKPTGGTNGGAAT